MNGPTTARKGAVGAVIITYRPQKSILSPAAEKIVKNIAKVAAKSRFSKAVTFTRVAKSDKIFMVYYYVHRQAMAVDLNLKPKGGSYPNGEKDENHGW